MRKKHRLLILDYVIAWAIGLTVYSLVRQVGTIERDGIELSVTQGLLMTPVFAILFGTVFGLAQLNFERLYNKRTPLIRLFLLRFILSILVITLATFVAYLIFTFILDATDLSYGNFAFNAAILVFYGYVIFVDILISLFRQMSLMLGPGVLKKLVTGQFYTPREEDRIFMFLDLRSSTEMAEKLGHFKYSEMIQDCFDDLAIVTKTEAEIYQYVGDEAVLTWTTASGLKDQNCIKAYRYFQLQMENRRNHYESKYGMIPFFKAGLNLGKVMVAEVGRDKKEIAYHGDTLNTAARIQGKCNDFDQSLLISEKLKQALGQSDEFHTKHMGEIPLKGKSAKVDIHAVSWE